MRLHSPLSSSLLNHLRRDSGNMRRDSGNMRRDSGNMRRDSGNMRRDSGNMRRDSGNLHGLDSAVLVLVANVDSIVHM
jgi:hypothetical protein